MHLATSVGFLREGLGYLQVTSEQIPFKSTEYIATYFARGLTAAQR